MKRVLRIALEDFQADLIHFDNTSMQAQPPIFTHPLAVKDFRAWLERKYTPGSAHGALRLPGSPLHGAAA